ncbi:ExbD/TolR family protein [Pseudoalteromonas sp. SS15]|uniref:ExbD/TolR family protein n=1 Tax=Pseudoalteromonas sp. SS15 TaxID=3139393 RepID=UPI003BA8AF43
MELSKYSKPNRPVNLLPLMDVIFLVLAVFFYLMLFMVRHEGMKVDLPSADNSQSNTQVFKSISIDSDNNLFFDKQAVEWAQLSKKVVELKSTHKDDIVIYIAADNKSQYEYFVKVLDTLKSNEIFNVNIETSGSK